MPERPTKIAWTSACSRLWSCMKSIYNRTLRQRLLFWILHIKAYQACQVCKWWKLFIRRLKEAFGSKLMIVAAPSITMRRLRRAFISAGSPSSTEDLWCVWGERYGRWRGHRHGRGRRWGPGEDVYQSKVKAWHVQTVWDWMERLPWENVPLQSGSYISFLSLGKFSDHRNNKRSRNFQNF